MRRDGKPKWLKRRKLYAGGAMMVLVPFGGGCEKSDQPKGPPDTNLPEETVQAELPDGYVAPEVIAIAPRWDPGPIETLLDALETHDPAAMEVSPEAMAIAPVDILQDVTDPYEPPEVMAIAPLQDITDPGHPPEIMTIAPVPDATGPMACERQGEWCTDDLVCQAQAICIVPTECCGGCLCQPLACNPSEPVCPERAQCVKDSETTGHCVRTPAEPGGFMAKCDSDDDCLQEFFCEQTMFCIAPPPGSGSALPAGCNEKNCVPRPCKETCPPGAECLWYAGNKLDPEVPKTCVRSPGKVPGGFAADCKNSKICISNHYWCTPVSPCPPGVFCIVPVDPNYLCLPIGCDQGCPDGSECEDNGIAKVCVKKDA